MKKLARLLLPILVLAAGCASTSRFEWVKPGVTDAQKERDKSDCLLDSTETLPGLQGPQRRLNQDRYHRCLQARGYVLKETAEPR